MRAFIFAAASILTTLPDIDDDQSREV